MSDKEKVVTNSDNELLEPGQYGFVDEVNGPGAEEIQGFVPTRHELIQIVKYWAYVELDLTHLMHVYQQTGSDWLRKTSFAGRRVGRISRILGDDEVKKAVDEVYAEFIKKMDKRLWNVFVNGTAEEQAAVEEEIWRKFDWDTYEEPK